MYHSFGAVFTSENYEVARKLLIEQYENPKLICKLFQYKPLDRACPKRLSELLSFFNSHLRSLASLKRPIEQWDDLIVFMISSKFDPETKSKWIDVAPNKKLATLQDISTFIKQRCIKLEGQAISLSKPTQSTVRSQTIQPSKSPSTVSFHASSPLPKYNCNYCRITGHSILRCRSFKALDTEKRREYINRMHLCFNCLKPNHSANSCPDTNSCHVCQRKHHTLIHRDVISTTSSSNHQNTNSSSSTDQFSS